MIGGLDDGALVERFVASRDEAAFEVLVARHGPMVHRICRAALGDPDDADDALQAVFHLATLIETETQRTILKPVDSYRMARQPRPLEALGRLMAGADAIQGVYRLVTPTGGPVLSSTHVLTVTKSDPGWAKARGGKTEALTWLVEEALHREPPGADGPEDAPRSDRARVPGNLSLIPKGDAFVARWNSYEDDQPRTRTLRPKLERPVTLEYPRGIALGRFLAEVSKAIQDPDGRGVPIYVDEVSHHRPRRGGVGARTDARGRLRRLGSDAGHAGLARAVDSPGIPRRYAPGPGRRGSDQEFADGRRPGVPARRRPGGTRSGRGQP